MLIVHASDLTRDDTTAFLHAAALTRNGSRLVTVHAGPEISALPSAAELSARWGRPIEHELRRVEIDEDVPDSVLEQLRQLGPDLVVVGTHARHGLAAWLRGSIAEAIARNLVVPVLVVPNRARGFVSAQTGAVDLRKIVVPAGSAEDARLGIDAAHRLAGAVGAAADCEVVHVGPRDPDLDRLGLPVVQLQGPLEDAIVSVARTRDARLIAMVTRGHDQVGDVLLGSHTERVIREAGCPVLSVRI
jgi:nucleotide-binding universal stress UspA family protein